MSQSAITPAIPALEGEIWLPVQGFETLYLVSDQGRVWSARGTGRLLKPARRGSPGYPKLGVILCDGPSVRWQVFVHQLVMLAFVGPYPEGQEIRHGRGGPLDNRLVNLCYGTHAENGRDMIEHGHANGCGKLGSKHPKAKLTEDLVRQIRVEYAAGGVTEQVLADRHGVNVSTLHRLLARQTWQHVA